MRTTLKFRILFCKIKSHQAVGEASLWAASSPQGREGWSRAPSSTGTQPRRAGLEFRRRKTPPAHLCFPRKGRESTPIWGPPHAVHPEAQRNKHFPLPLSLKRSKQFLFFVPGSWGVLELNQQLFKTLNVLENTGELKSTISLKKGKYNINPKLRSKGTSSRWCYLF